ncbi:MAG: exonuclease SbcCD subunit D C-terminal domain-containing protein [Fibrobacterales bacterium]
MRVLHTSDWHIGHSLHRQKRYSEYEHFFEWLLEIIEREQCEMLLVAGDIFDTTAPSNRAQKLYYTFLMRAAQTCCKSIVIIAGNHDSASLLQAPKELLSLLDVHVVGSMSESVDDEIILMHSDDGGLKAVVCAVPYLRDRDVRKVEAGETIDDKQQKLVMGVKDHYNSVVERAVEVRGSDTHVPIIALGHLFAAGGELHEGDGVRDLYVGNLGHISGELFPKEIDYLALGHLHIPQKVGGNNHMRYSGSPLPMGFGEAYQKKEVSLVVFDERVPRVEAIGVPLFQRLERLSGTMEQIEVSLRQLVSDEVDAWVDIEYTGVETITDLNERVHLLVEESLVVILLVKNRQVIDAVLSRTEASEVLNELSDRDVFEKLLAVKGVDESEHDLLLATYTEVVTEMLERDSRGE